MYPNLAHVVNINTNQSSGSDVGVGVGVGSSEMDPRLAMSAQELARKIRNKKDSLTSRELVDLCIAHMKRLT